MDANEYQCSACKGIFEKTWTDEEAADEALDNFGDLAGVDTAVVCDDCYQEIMGSMTGH